MFEEKLRRIDNGMRGPRLLVIRDKAECERECSKQDENGSRVRTFQTLATRHEQTTIDGPQHQGLDVAKGVNVVVAACTCGSSDYGDRLTRSAARIPKCGDPEDGTALLQPT